MAKRKKKTVELLSEPVDCIDGENIYSCWWTGKRVKESKMILTPPIMSNVKGMCPAAPGYEAARQESYIAFCDCEENCNTCKHLERVKHEKCRHGWLHGRCKSTPINHPYIEKPRNWFFSFLWTIALFVRKIFFLNLFWKVPITFHPDDPMYMECYESRFISNLNENIISGLNEACEIRCKQKGYKGYS